MARIPTDLPERLRDAGLVVHVVEGWESRGGDCDHRAVIFHWTASSASESPSSCANYSFIGADNAPHYNLLVDRNGEVWVGARDKSNSSGEISHVARDEAFRGAVDWRSAASRGLPDTCSANANLWAISAQNTGTGEPWSEALKHGMAVAAAVSLDALGLTRSTYTSHHAAVTARKIDLTTGTGGCPSGDEWNRRISDELGGGEDDVNEADFDRIAADVQRIVTDVLRKEGVSGAAGKADVFSDAEKADIQRIVTDVLRKEGVSEGTR